MNYQLSTINSINPINSINLIYQTPSALHLQPYIDNFPARHIQYLITSIIYPVSSLQFYFPAAKRPVGLISSIMTMIKMLTPVASGGNR